MKFKIIFFLYVFFVVLFPAVSADCYCVNCSDCNDKLNNVSCDIVYLNASVYNESATCINMPENFTNKVFDCQGYVIDGDRLGGGTDSGILVNKSNVTIQNCVVTDFIYGLDIWYGSHNNTFKNNTVSNNTNTGIMLDSSSYNNVSNNTVEGNINYNIWVNTGSVYNNISDNTLKYGYAGVLVWDDYNNIVGNLVYNNTYGIYLASAYNNNISNNTIKFSNRSGIHVTATCINTTLNNNLVCSNNISGGGYYDIVNYDTTNVGTGNTCNTTLGWNDTGLLGCSLKCDNSVNCYCASCSKCSSLFNNCTTVYLSANLSGLSEACIYNNNISNKIFNCQNNTLTGNGIYLDLNFSGVYLEGNNNVSVRDCIISAFYKGVYLNNSFNNTVSNCVFSGNDYGMMLENSSSNNLTNNSYNNNDYNGITISNSNLNIFSSNNVKNNLNNGVQITLSSNNNTVNSNIITNNTKFGVYFVSSGNNSMNDNELCGNILSDVNASAAGWFDNSGVRNECNSTEGWNDTGYVGCRYFCNPSCSNCSNCSDVIANNRIKAGRTVSVTGNLTGENCLPQNNNFSNFIFDCAGYVMLGTFNGSGISLYNNGNLTIKNCNIQNYSYGIVGLSCFNITLQDSNFSLNNYSVFFNDMNYSYVYRNNITSTTKQYGIMFNYNNKNFILENNTVSDGFIGFYGGSNNNGGLKKNVFCGNSYDIYGMTVYITGVNNTCNTSYGGFYDNNSKLTCASRCGASPHNCDVGNAYCSSVRFTPTKESYKICITTNYSNWSCGFENAKLISIWNDSKIGYFNISTVSGLVVRGYYYDPAVIPLWFVLLFGSLGLLKLLDFWSKQ